MHTFVPPEVMAKKATIRTWTLITGLATALVIIVSQLFYFAAPQHTKKDVQTEQQQNQSDDAGSFITLPSSTLPSTTTHVEFQQESFCLFEILFEEGEVTETAFDFKLPVGKLFLTLFQTIISPNAP